MAAENWVNQGGYLSNVKLNREFYKAAQPLMNFKQFVSFKNALGKHEGESVNFLRVANVSDYGGKLQETNTMHETEQDKTWGTLTVTEYGNSIPFTLKVETLSRFELMDILRDGLLDDARKCIDGEIERQFNATPLRYVGTATDGFAYTTNGTATATNTSALNRYHVRQIVKKLKANFVPGWPALGGDYAAIVSLEAWENICADMETVNQYTPAGYKKILNGEVGKYHGVRFIEDQFATRFVYDSTARTATAKSWTGSLSLDGYFFGAPTVMEAMTWPLEVRRKLVSDYGRSKGLAWYFLGGWKIIRDTAANARIVKWDSA
jgi:N4-gp56 family major capsid protein